MRIQFNECVLVALSSLVVLNNKATAFTLDGRPQTLRLSDVNSFIGSSSVCEEDITTSTRLCATSPGSSEQYATYSRNDKSTTVLRAATGISLSSAPSLATPTIDESNDGGLGVLFLNLGGPTTGDDVEGTSGGSYRDYVMTRQQVAWTNRRSLHVENRFRTLYLPH